MFHNFPFRSCARDLPRQWRSEGWGGGGGFPPHGPFFLRRGLLNFKCIIRRLILNPRVLSQAIRSAQKCCQNAGNVISEPKISKHFRTACPRTPLEWTALRRVRMRYTPSGGGQFKNSIYFCDSTSQSHASEWEKSLVYTGLYRDFSVADYINQLSYSTYYP